VHLIVTGEKMHIRICLFIIVALLGGCTGIPDGITPVENLEINRYLGKWYEIARLDHSFERGLNNVTAEYGLRDDGGINVLNRGYDPEKQKWKEAEGRGYFIGDRETGRLKVSFFWPFYGGYNIIELDKTDYQYTLVCGPDRSYLWILARTPGLDPAITGRLVSKAREPGFETDELI
jgi:apolipoprotein D and lipocalin family protein